MSGLVAVKREAILLPHSAVRWSVGTLPTDYTYTGQRADATGLMYHHPSLGQFVSADMVVPNQQLASLTFARSPRRREVL